MFGAQQQKPLFGGAPAAATSTAFGAPAAAAAPAFGAPAAASTAGGLFGKPAFGAATTTSTAGEKSSISLNIFGHLFFQVVPYI